MEFGQGGARALLCSFGHYRLSAIKVELVSHAAASEDRAQLGHAELGRLLQHQVEAIFLQQCRTEPEIRHHLFGAKLLCNGQRNSALRDVCNLRRPLACLIVTQDDNIALAGGRLLTIFEPGEPFPSPELALRDDLVSALVNLGYQKHQADKAVGTILREEPELTFEIALKKSLLRLSV